MTNRLNQFPRQEQHFYLAGPVGKLEIIATPPVTEARSVTAIMCHPHSQQGGTMNNKVVTTMVRTFKALGMKAVRFNFRSVGESEGTFANGVGEVDDLAAVIEWVRQVNPNDDILLAGFSFGSYVAARAASEHEPVYLISVAPPVHHYDFAELTDKITSPWLVLMGEADEVVPPEEVYDWVKSFKQPPQLVRFPETGHFFHGKLLDLKDRVLTVLEEL
ncbi:MAG: hypothetical protein CMF50_01165 [Legionellales bacterium]|nr:hypothetical protein [Legionellales bacterium]|tara:strand:+ start:5769 stop:6422 length:654 start_codon:yes stop_codon:yes gene_type:complete